MSSTILLPPAQLCIRYCSNKQQLRDFALHRHGFPYHTLCAAQKDVCGVYNEVDALKWRPMSNEVEANVKVDTPERYPLQVTGKNIQDVEECLDKMLELDSMYIIQFALRSVCPLKSCTPSCKLF